MSSDIKTPAIVVELENGRFVSVYGNTAAEGTDVFLVNRQSDDPADDLLAPYDFTAGEVEDRDSDVQETVDVARLELTESPWGITALAALLDNDSEDASIDDGEDIEDDDI